MKYTADIVIIGGGISGCSLAYYLTKAGFKKIILLEKSHLSSGATGSCGGGIRTLVTSGIKIKLAKESRKLFDEMQQELQFEKDLELNNAGYLILAYSEKSLEEIVNTIPFQKEHGVPVEYLKPGDVKSFFPAYCTKGLLGAAFHKDGASINPHLVTVAYAEAARRNGVYICNDTEAINFKIENGRINVVVTNRGDISTSVVVNASGMSFDLINKMSGINHDIINVECIDSWITNPIDKIECPAITISYQDPFFLVSQRKNGNIHFMGNVRNFPGIQNKYRNENTIKEISDTFQFITRALPSFRKLKILRHWTGPIPVSPDTHPVLGKSKALDNFYFAGLLNGHGFTLAPVIGKLMADVIQGEEPEISIETMDFERFERGEMLESHGLL